jgi:hypothetical protein
MYSIYTYRNFQTVYRSDLIHPCLLQIACILYLYMFYLCYPFPFTSLPIHVLLMLPFPFTSLPIHVLLMLPFPFTSLPIQVDRHVHGTELIRCNNLGKDAQICMLITNLRHVHDVFNEYTWIYASRPLHQLPFAKELAPFYKGDPFD